MQFFRVGRTGQTLFPAPTETLRKPPAVHPSLRRGFSPEHSIQRLPFIGGQPPPRDGSLGGRRRGGHRVVFVVLRCRQSQRGQSVVPLGQREPAEQQQSGQRLLRALRPASTGAVFQLHSDRNLRNDLRPGVTERLPRLPSARPADSAIRRGCGPCLREAPAIQPSLRQGDFPCRNSSQRLLSYAAAGYRNNATGALDVVGTNGYCWSSSSYNAGNNNAGMLNFNSGNVNPLNGGNRAIARAVRCVQHLPGISDADRTMRIRTAPYDPEWQGPRFQPERSVDSAIRWRCPGPRARKRRQLYIPAYCGVAALRGAPSRQTFQRLRLTLKLRATATPRREP